MALKKMPRTGVTRTALVGLALVVLVAGAMGIARRGPGVLEKMTGAASPAPAVAEPAPKLLLVAPAQDTGRATPVKPSRSAAAKPAAKPAVVIAAATTPAAVTPANAVSESLDVVTLTGCLQHDDGTFRLKDTSGTDAPKSRSWKSGFLKKRGASIEIVDSAKRLGLPSHVGQRVTVTGILLDREMRVRAVQRVGVCS